MKVANPTHQTLMAENRKLKEQLAALKKEQDPISVNPAQGTVKIRNYQTDSYTIERLDLQGEGITEMTEAMSRLDRWVKPRPTFPDVGQSLRSKITVSDMKVALPFSTMNDLIPKISGPQLKEAGIRSISISAGERPDEIAIRGRVKKLLEVGFDATGRVSLTEAGEPRFKLEKSHVAGIPMPNFMASLATALFAGKMAEMGVRKEGESFVLDPKKLMPKNVDAQVTSLSVNQSGLVVEGGKPYFSAAT